MPDAALSRLHGGPSRFPWGPSPSSAGRRPMRRAARITGTVMMVAGVMAIGWALLVWQWQDPFTAIYTKYEQHKLADSFAKRFDDYRPARPAPGIAKHEQSAERRVAAAAVGYPRGLAQRGRVGAAVAA